MCVKLIRQAILGIALAVLGRMLNQGASPVIQFDGFKNAVVALAYAPDGTRIAIADESSEIAVIDTVSGRTLSKLGSYEVAGSRMVWSPDGTQLYRLGNNAWVVSDGDGKNPRTIRADFSGCRQLALSPDGRVLALAGTGKVGTWATRDGKLMDEVEPHPNWRISHLAFSPDGKWLISASDDRAPRLLEFSGLKSIEPGLPGQEAKPVACEFHPVTGEILMLDRSARLHRFDPHTFKDRPVRVSGPEVQSMAISRDGKWIALAGGSEVKVFEWSTGGWRRLQLTNTALGARSVAISPDSRFIAVGDHDSRVRLWEIEKLEPLKAE